MAGISNNMQNNFMNYPYLNGDDSVDYFRDEKTKAAGLKKKIKDASIPTTAGTKYSTAAYDTYSYTNYSFTPKSTFPIVNPEVKDNTLIGSKKVERQKMEAFAAWSLTDEFSISLNTGVANDKITDTQVQNKKMLHNGLIIDDPDGQGTFKKTHNATTYTGGLEARYASAPFSDLFIPGFTLKSYSASVGLDVRRYKEFWGPQAYTDPYKVKVGGVSMSDFQTNWAFRPKLDVAAKIAPHDTEEWLSFNLQAGLYYERASHSDGVSSTTTVENGTKKETFKAMPKYSTYEGGMKLLGGVETTSPYFKAGLDVSLDPRVNSYYSQGQDKTYSVFALEANSTFSAAVLVPFNESYTLELGGYVSGKRALSSYSDQGDQKYKMFRDGYGLTAALKTNYGTFKLNAGVKDSLIPTTTESFKNNDDGSTYSKNGGKKSRDSSISLSWEKRY